MRHTAHRPSARSGAAPGTRPAVLVVEDTTVTRRVVVGQLEQLGYRTRVAADGAEALETLDDECVDLVLMDCQLPGISGRETARRIRRGESGDRRTPIIALSTSERAGERARCLRAGMDDFLAKPVTAEALARALARWLPAAPVPNAERARLEAEIAAEYLREAPRVRDRLARALGADDLATAAAAAHELGGISVYVAGADLARHCGELAERARRGDPAACERTLARVDEALARVCTRLRDGGGSHR